MNGFGISSDSDVEEVTPPVDLNKPVKETPGDDNIIRVKRLDTRKLKAKTPRETTPREIKISARSVVPTSNKKTGDKARMADAITTAHRRQQQSKPSFKSNKTLMFNASLSPIDQMVSDTTPPKDQLHDASSRGDRIEPVNDREKFDLDLSKLKYKTPRSYRPDLKPRESAIQTTIDTVVDMGDDVNIYVSPGDVDRLAVDMIEELMIQVDKHINWTYNKAYFYKGLEKLIYLTLQGISATCTILGLMLGSSGNESSSFFFITGVLNAIGLLIFEVNDRYKFDKTASKLFQCTQDFEEMKTELRELKVSPLGPIQRLDAIRSYEKRLNKIEMDAFNSQTFKIGGPTEFNSCKGDVDYFQPIKPDDIPVEELIVDPVKPNSSQLGDIISRRNDFSEDNE